MISASSQRIRITASVATIKATAVVVRANSSVAQIKVLAQAAFEALHAAIHAPAIAFGVQAQLLKAVAITGHFIDYLQFANEASFTDELSFDLSRTLESLAQIADTAAVTAGKTFDDGFSVSDVQIASLNKGLADLLGFTDVKVFAMAKPLRDDPIVTDQYAASTSRPLADKFQWREGPGIDDYALNYFLEDYGYDGKPVVLLNKGRADSAALTDRIDYIRVNKGLTETPALTDVLTKSLSFHLADTISATDDFLGVANVDDDEVMTLKKALADSINLGDTFVRVVAFVRNPADSAALTDSSVNRVGKGLTEAPALTDFASFLLRRTFADSAAASDLVAKLYQKSFADSGAFTDSTAKQTGKGLDDGAGFTDSPRFNTAKPLSDSSALSDVKLFSFAKPLSDSAAASDSTAKSIRPSTNDSAALTDSGSIWTQGYFAANYVAVDYVGTQTTF